MKHLIVALGICVAAAPAGAAVLDWSAMLDQAQEVPAPVMVPGAMGAAMGTIDTVTGDLTWSISYSGLSGAATGMHFHGPAPVGSTAGVRVNAGAISGLGSPSAGSTIISASEIGEMLGGLWYINIHTNLNAPGEIRGQVNVVPVPMALPLFGFALAGLLAVGRRRA